MSWVGVRGACDGGESRTRGLTESDRGASADVKSGVPMERCLGGGAEMQVAKGGGAVAAACVRGRAVG